MMEAFITNVFDFDNTIYDGESTFDFYLFCVKHHPKALKFVLIVIWSLFKYKLCLVSETQLMNLAEKYVSDFLMCCPDADELAHKFWHKNFRKIKPFYNDVKREDDVVISASFGFLLRPALEKLGVKNFILSEVNLDNSKVLRLCYRKNKLKLFNEYFDGTVVDDVYTDSYNDLPLMSLASKRIFLVKGNRIIDITKEKSDEYE